MSPFKIEKKDVFPFLRKLIATIIGAINARTPKAGFGISIEDKPDGEEISVNVSELSDALSGSSGGAIGSGTPVDIYGAFNGAPATYHLLESSAPTPIP